MFCLQIREKPFRKQTSGDAVMSWLYSIFLAGLLFSSNGTLPASSNLVPSVEEPKAAAAGQDETEKLDRTYPLSADGRISVSNVNGSIVVEAWDKNEVRLEAIKTADSPESLAAVEIKIDSRPDVFTVEASYGSWKNNRDGGRNNMRVEVAFRLWAPRTAVLSSIETVNGSVTVSNFSNFTKISAVNGSVVAANLRGAAEMSTVNGEVSADFGELTAANRINLSTVNGRVNLVIPSDANATVRADSLNGSISNEFGLPVRKGKYIGRDLFGRLGGGQTPIRLSSVNGTLSIGRRSDGKTPGPATDLLQQKRGDEDSDIGNDEISTFDNRKINRDIERALSDSARQSVKALKQAQKELENIKPELDKINLEAAAKVNVNIDPDRIKAQVAESLARQREVLARLASVRLSASVPTIRKKTNTFPVKGVPTVVIDAKPCSVTVRGWDKPEVRYVLTKSSDEPGASETAVTEDANESSVTIRVSSGGDENYDDLGQRLEVFVPRKSDLKITADGEIRLEGVTGTIELNGRDQAINVRDARGTMKLTAAGADARIIGFNGELESSTGDGDLYLEGSFTALAAKSAEGNVILTLQENANLSIASNNEIVQEGIKLKRAGDGLWQIGSGGVRYNFEFGDGSLVVRSAAYLSRS